MENALKPPEGCSGCSDQPGSMSPSQPLEQPPIPGISVSWPSPLLLSLLLCQEDFTLYNSDVLGDSQGWGWDGTGGDVKVWNLLPHPRGCPGSPLLEHGGRTDFSPGYSGDVSGAVPELSVRCPLVRCCRLSGARLLCWQRPLAPAWLGLFSFPRTSGAVWFHKLWLAGKS